MTDNNDEHLTNLVLEHLARPIFYNTLSTNPSSPSEILLSRLKAHHESTQGVTLSLHHLLSGWSRYNSGGLILKITTTSRLLSAGAFRVYVVPPNSAIQDLNERCPHIFWDTSAKKTLTLLINPTTYQFWIPNATQYTSETTGNNDEISLGKVVLKSVSPQEGDHGVHNLLVTYIPLFDYKLFGKTTIGNRLFSSV